MVVFLEVFDVMAIHQALVEFFALSEDPIDPPGVRDPLLLESALTRPRTSLGPIEKYRSVPQECGLIKPGICGFESDANQRLLGNRYIGDGSDHPRRGYAYVRGPLKLFRDEPEVVVTDVSQITDSPAG